MFRNNLLVKLSLALFFVILISTFQTVRSNNYVSGQSNDPIAFIGHGAIFDNNGNEIEVTPEFVREAQEFYLADLYKQASPEQQARFTQERERLFAGRQWDEQSELVANTALIDWLLDEVNPPHAGTLRGKNNLIKVILRTRLFDPVGAPFEPPSDLTALLEEEPIVAFSTLAEGQAYIDECAASGVPIPPDWGSPQWVNTGTLSDAQEFISVGYEAKVYKYESTAPEGACIALPRVDGGGMIQLLGIICLGKATSKACFWDNQVNDNGFPIPEGVPFPLSGFAGGATLEGGSGGVCTACHAGENPYVIHPNTALGMPALGSLEIRSDDWYDPLVHPDWPQNAGPTNILDAIPSAVNCTSCHTQAGTGGRFPQISTLHADPGEGYCDAVLDNAIARTMPPGAAGSAIGSAHVMALQNLCAVSPIPLLRVEETTLDYKEVELGFAFAKALVIHNDGDAPLTVSVDTITPAGDPNLDHWDEINELTSIPINPGDPPVVLRQVYAPQDIGAHSIQMAVTSSDPSNPSQLILLTGNGITPIPVDTMLVLDRSASMSDPAGERNKIEAMRDAASLYTDLLREDNGGSGTGDKLGFVKYNHQNSVYMAFDFITQARKNAIENNELSDGALTDVARLAPSGSTGIGGAMQTGANELGGPLTDRKQVLVVLTDGKENEAPYINDVIDDIQSANANLQMYSVGLGWDIEPTKLQNITNMGEEGYHQVSGSLSGVNLFDLETFYFKIFSNATGMDLVVDPTHVVNLLNTGLPITTPIIIDNATIISSDHSATFLVLDDPVLRTFYDLEFVSPLGEVIVPGVTIGGIPIQEMSRHTYKIYRIVFPELAQADTYVGNWVLRLTPNGRWSRNRVRQALVESEIAYSTYITPTLGLVPIGFAAAVASDYKLDVEVLPSSYLPGADVTLMGSLSDRGWPAPAGQVNVVVTAPDNSTYPLTLFDDGTHSDLEADDATWTNHFIQTGNPGVYKFFFQSVGYNERGELAPREATRYITLMQPERTPDGDKGCSPCDILRQCCKKLTQTTPFTVVLAGQPVNTPGVQQAILHAVAWQELTEQIFPNQDVPVAVDLWEVGPVLTDAREVPFDPERARALLAEADFPNRFRLLLFFSSGDEQLTSMAEGIARMLSELGLDVELSPVPMPDAPAKVAAAIAAGEPVLWLSR